MMSVYDVIGFVGGLITASALLPQIHHVIVRKSTADISYAYQGFFAMGLCMFVAYYGYYELWSIFCTAVLGLSLMCILIGLKIYMEWLPAGKAAAAVGGPAVDEFRATDDYPRRGTTTRGRGAGKADGAPAEEEQQPMMSSW